MDVKLRYTHELVPPTSIEPLLAPPPHNKIQEHRQRARESLVELFAELNRPGGPGAIYVPSGLPVPAWQCDDNNQLWEKYSPWIYTETPNRTIIYTARGPVVYFVQGLVDPRFDDPRPLFSPGDKSDGFSQTEAVLFFRFRCVALKAHVKKIQRRVPFFSTRDGKLVRGEKTVTDEKVIPITDTTPPRIHISVGCTE